MRASPDNITFLCHSAAAMNAKLEDGPADHDATSVSTPDEDEVPSQHEQVREASIPPVRFWLLSIGYLSSAPEPLDA